jgi:hypothetical protein
VGSISPTGQHDAIEPSPVATVESVSLLGAAVNSGRGRKMEYLLCPSQVPGGLENGQN